MDIIWSEYFPNVKCQVLIYLGSCLPGLNPINKNLSSEKFSDKNLRILNPKIFSENILVLLAGQISENFSSEYCDRNTPHLWNTL